MNDLTKLDVEITIEHDNLVVRLIELGRVNNSVIAESSVSLEYLAEAIAKHQKRATSS